MRSEIDERSEIDVRLEINARSDIQLSWRDAIIEETMENITSSWFTHAYLTCFSENVSFFKRPQAIVARLNILGGQRAGVVSRSWSGLWTEKLINFVEIARNGCDRIL